MKDKMSYLVPGIKSSQIYRFLCTIWKFASPAEGWHGKLSPQFTWFLQSLSVTKFTWFVQPFHTATGGLAGLWSSPLQHSSVDSHCLSWYTTIWTLYPKSKATTLRSRGKLSSVSSCHKKYGATHGVLKNSACRGKNTPYVGRENPQTLTSHH
jgi:hypothetical protein